MTKRSTRFVVYAGVAVLTPEVMNFEAKIVIENCMSADLDSHGGIP